MITVATTACNIQLIANISYAGSQSVKSATRNVHPLFELITQAFCDWSDVFAMHSCLLKEVCRTRRIKK